MSHSYYNVTDHLTGTMLEFGKYTLKYKPPKGAAETKVKMEITSEVAIPELLVFFEDFMRASGYILDGKRLSLEREAPDFSFLDKWGADPGYFSCYPDGTPYQLQDFGSHYAGPFGAGASFKGAEGAQATGGIGGKGAE